LGNVALDGALTWSLARLQHDDAVEAVAPQFSGALDDDMVSPPFCVVSCMGR
jgi:hypothetical protein